MLKVRKLKKSYQNKQILHDVSFDVQEGEIVGLLGPNGAGKTTAFYLTIGLIKPDGGHVHFLNKDITLLPIEERAKMGMGYLAQEPSIFRGLTVEENLLCILELIEKDKKKRKERLQELLAELHLENLAKKIASTLSGGERRRLEITRALITNPKLLLLDEPFANIDPLVVHDVKQMIRHLKSKEISILITDHNAREIFSVVHRAYVMIDGEILAQGTPHELASHEGARRIYLGEELADSLCQMTRAP